MKIGTDTSIGIKMYSSPHITDIPYTKNQKNQQQKRSKQQQTSH